MLKAIAGLVFGFGLALGQVTVPCRETAIQPMKSFDISKILGKEWYDIAGFSNFPNWRISENSDEKNTGDWKYKCPSLSLTETEVPYVYRQNLNWVLANTTTKMEDSMSNLLKSNRTNPAVTYYGTGKDLRTFILVETDYKSWILSYQCVSDSKDTFYEFLSIRGRFRKLDTTTYNLLVSSAVKLEFSKESMVVENQTDC